MEDLIVKYLQNAITSSEAKDLRAWLESDSRNRRVFENIVGEWKLKRSEIEDSKRSVFQRVTHEERITIDDKSHVIHRPLIVPLTFKVAASLSLILAISWIISLNIAGESSPITIEDEPIEKITDMGQKLTFELPDGSIVKLNSGSKLRYPKTFSSNQRQVVLVGEAFFDVVRDEDRPFIIKSGGIITQVLGTSFDVRAYPDEQECTVGVKTGKVKVISDRGGAEVILEPKEKVEFISLTNQMKTDQITEEDLMFGWTNKILTFKDEDLKQILLEIERWYNIEIIVDEQYLNKQKKEFTAKYEDPNLTEVLESLAYSYDFTYEHDLEKRTVKITR